MAETSSPTPKSSENGLKATKAMPAQGAAAPTPRKTPINQIYTLPAPIRTYPLPSFYPNNPVSLIHLVYTWVKTAIFPPPSEPSTIIEGIWSPETRSVHVVDQKSIRALWEQGFYGKGNFSRSEPNWLNREKKRKGLVERHVAEEHTAARRQERLQMKWDRARKEQEAIEKTRLEEAWVAPVGPLELLALPNSTSTPVTPKSPPHDVSPPVTHASEWLENKEATHTNGHASNADSVSNFVINGSPGGPGGPKPEIKRRKSVRFSPNIESTTYQLSDPPSPGSSGGVNGKVSSGTTSQTPDIPNMANGSAHDSRFAANLDPVIATEIVDVEHLQITLEEAFFLNFGIGALSVIDPTTKTSVSTDELFALFRRHSYFPPRAMSDPLEPGDPFLVNYAVYHHFRSIGWVPRSGIKFGVDWLLYNRGPVFSHAEFAVVVIPSYTHPWWKAQGKKQWRKSWHWLHGINRVQAQALKTLVFAYVDVPPPSEGNVSIAEILSRFRIREVVVKRWLSNRNRD